jgi:hypothetical protein
MNYPPGGNGPPGYPRAGSNPVQGHGHGQRHPLEPGYGQQPGCPPPGPPATYGQPGYGPPAGGFGGPAQGAFGPMQLAAVPYAGATGAVRPTARNAFVCGVLPLLVAFAGTTVFALLAALLEVGPLVLVAQAIQLGCSIWFLFNMMRGLHEMRSAAQNTRFPRWPVFIPIYSIIYWVSMVPAEVRKAKQMRGVAPTSRNIALYFLFPVVALQGDLNDLAGAP